MFQDKIPSSGLYFRPLDDTIPCTPYEDIEDDYEPLEQTSDAEPSPGPGPGREESLINKDDKGEDSTSLYSEV